MAYIDQTKKKAIAAQLKGVIPATWRYSLAIQHHSTLVLTIRQADIDIIPLIKMEYPRDYYKFTVFVNSNTNFPTVTDVELKNKLQEIANVMNAGNYDRSDSQSDYFCVGWYVKIKIGDWGKPLKII